MRVMVALFMLITFCSNAVQIVKGDPLVVAETIVLPSAILAEQREIFISLPANYEQEQHAYPVLVVLDAQQSMFHAVPSARLLSQWRGLPDLIIVGIPSVNRLRDFTHDHVPSQSDESGGADKFTQFVTQELMPYVNANYRAHPYTLVAGHSLGGLYVANEMLSDAQPYDGHILIAPALWWNEFATIEKAKTHVAKARQRDKTAFFGIGELDGYGMKNELSQYIENLSNNASVSLRYQHEVYAAEGHMSAPLKTLYDGLVHVFADITYHKEKWGGFTVEGFVKHEQSMLEKYGPTATQTAETYVHLAEHLLQKGSFKGALAVQQANAAAYPEYPRNHEGLANTYLLLGDKANAKQQFRLARKHAMSNTSSGSGAAERYLAEMQLIDNPVFHSPDALKALQGCYKVGQNTQLKIQEADGKLGVRINGGSTKQLFDTDNLAFRMRLQPYFTFTFAPPQSSEPAALIVDEYGARYDAQPVSCSDTTAGTD